MGEGGDGEKCHKGFFLSQKHHKWGSVSVCLDLARQFWIGWPRLCMSTYPQNCPYAQDISPHMLRVCFRDANCSNLHVCFVMFSRAFSPRTDGFSSTFLPRSHLIHYHLSARYVPPSKFLDIFGFCHSGYSLHDPSLHETNRAKRQVLFSFYLAVSRRHVTEY